MENRRRHEALHQKRAASSIIREDPLLIKRPRTEEEDIAGCVAAFIRAEEEQEEIQACTSALESELSHGQEELHISPSLMVGAGDSQTSLPFVLEEALECTVSGYSFIFPRTNQPLQILQEAIHQLAPFLTEYIHALEGIKWFISIEAIFHQGRDMDILTDPPVVFRAPSHAAYTSDTLERDLSATHQHFTNAIEEFLHHGSGWVLNRIIKLEVGIVKVAPLSGSTYIPLPKDLGTKRALLNIRNTDEKCFVWAVLAALYPVQHGENANRVCNYSLYEPELNMEGISYPVKIKDIPRFEHQNPDISINVLGWDNHEVFPLYVTQQRQRLHHINLLLYSKDQTQHYCLVKSMSRLLRSQVSYAHGERFFCDYCLHGFYRQALLNVHLPLCQPHGAQKTRMPDDDKAELTFTKIENQLKHPFVIYADFECLLPAVSSCSPNPENSSTTPLHRHEPCGYCYYVVSVNPDYNQAPVVYRGPDAATHFLNALQEENNKIREILKDVQPVTMTPEDQAIYDAADTCHICDFPLGADKVLDHCHLTGKYRGAAHNECNLNYRIDAKRMKIPVVLHNLRGYDSHLILRGYLSQHGKLACIANNMEKYISFDMGGLRFLDSAQFMLASLDSLVSNLSSDQFLHTQQWSPPDHLDLLIRKGVYPYEYMDCWNRFDETSLPPMEKFYSSLNKDTISAADYEHAINKI